MKVLTTKEFINKSNIIHNYKYNYECSLYKNNRTPIDILCNIHGIFSQKPNYHLSGNGCTRCGYNKIINIHTCSTEKFILKATKKHGNKYDYSKVKYNGSNELISIICLKHGEFSQSPTDHLRTSGCKECGYESTSKKIKYTQKDFINKSKEKHGEKYDYSNTNYIESFKKVKIICKIHGTFEQTPAMHIKGQGCPNCVNSKGESELFILLTSNNIKFETQKRFPNCKNIRTLPFDFYLLDFNICIEFQGIQHYESFHHFNGEKGFNLLIKNDEIKRRFCSQNNIKLLEIKYNENIKSKLQYFKII